VETKGARERGKEEKDVKVNAKARAFNGSELVSESRPF